MLGHKECHHQAWDLLDLVCLVSKVRRVCTDHQWVLDQDLIMLYLVILIKDLHHLAISKDRGMVPDPMVHRDHREVPVDLVDHRNKDHLDLGRVNIDHLECNFMVDHLDHPAKDHHVDHRDIPADHQEIQGELHLVLNGTDLQECIMGLRDRQVSLNINICKAHNRVKAHHKEDLLQVLWVVRTTECCQVQVDPHQGTEAHRRDHRKDLQAGQHHT